MNNTLQTLITRVSAKANATNPQRFLPQDTTAPWPPTLYVVRTDPGENKSRPLQSPPPTRSITLAHGFVLLFLENEVPPPPATSFANNLGFLNEIWDDVSLYLRY